MIRQSRKPVHDRVPVILPADSYTRRLDPEMKSLDVLLPLLRPYPAAAMAAVPVGLRVNNPRNDDPACVAEVALA